MPSKVLRNGTGLTIAGALLWFALSAAAPARAQIDNPAGGNAPVSAAQMTSPAPLLVLYQGRLLDPGSGQPKADGAYPMTFSLYPVNTGGAAIWTETKNIGLVRGVFSTYLGENTLLLSTYFDGQELWLGIKVGADAEAAPRQRIAFSPYAAYALRADTVTDPALTRDDEVVPIVIGSGFFSAAGHTHLGETWGSGNPLAFNGSFPAAPLVVNNSGGDGIQIQSAADDGIQISSTAFGVYAYSPTYTGFTASAPGGNGLSVYSAGGNGVYATNNNANDTIYARNDGTGKGISAYSYQGVPGWFGTYSNANLLVAEEEVTTGTWDVRFKVTRGGWVYADGGYLTPAADFAELLPAAPGLTPGDVLVVGADGQLQISSIPNAANVAGVYSTKPGFLGGVAAAAGTGTYPSVQGEQVSAAVMGDKVAGNGAVAGSTAANQPGAMQAKGQAASSVQAALATPGQVPLAIVGVVPVKVSAENGAIVPGDLLTTAALPGYAMKALPIDVGGVAIYRSGTLLGKALQPLASGTGVINVLVTLQ